MTGTASLLIAIAKRVAAGIVMSIVGYGAAGMVGGAIPANAGAVQPADGVILYIESNGIHTGIVMPQVAAGIDWRDLARPGDLRDPRYAGFDHVAVSWGEHGFFLGTPTWADVRPAPILHAALGSEATLLHVEHIPAPAADADTRMVRVTPDQYRRLAAYIRASVAPGGGHYPGYAANDTFYVARGRYDAFRTCNAWTGDALRQAGIRVGAWTPFPVTVIGWF